MLKKQLFFKSEKMREGGGLWKKNVTPCLSKLNLKYLFNTSFLAMFYNLFFIIFVK